MSEWLAVEAIVRQREKEKNDKALAKISAENKRNGSQVTAKHVLRQTELDNGDVDNDVFDDHDFSDISDPGMDFDDDIMIGIQEEKDSGNCEDEEDLMEQEEREFLKKENVTNSIKEEQDNEFKEQDEQNDQEGEEKDAFEVNEQSKDCLATDEPDSVVESQKAFEDNKLQMTIDKPAHIVCDVDENEPLSLQEHCFAESEPEAGLTPEQGGLLLLSIKSSPSTSSYETVGNEFTEMLEMAHDNGLPVEESVVEIFSEPTPIEEHHFEQKPDEGEEEEEAMEAFEMNEIEQNNGNTIQEESVRNYHSVEDVREMSKMTHAVIITEAASNDALECTADEPTEDTSRKTSLISPMNEDITVVASLDALQEPKSACVSPASSNGGVYSVSLVCFPSCYEG